MTHPKPILVTYSNPTLPGPHKAKAHFNFEACRDHLDVFINSQYGWSREQLERQINSWVAVPVDIRAKLISYLNTRKS